MHYHCVAGYHPCQPRKMITYISCMQDAIEAIFSAPGEGDTEGGPYRRHDDGKGFDLTVVPHPGDAEANVVWVDLGIRYAGFKRANSLRRAV